MARSQFTFKFANAQPGAPVTFSAAVYSSAVDAVADGPTLALDAQRTVAVWTDATELTATWVDGAGASIMAEASVARPIVTATGGVPGTAPTAASLPSQTSHGGQFLTTDGNNPAWAAVAAGTLLAPAPSGDTTGATDTVAINALITTASASGDGGVVQLRAGTYYSNGLLMKPMVTLRGAGWRTVVTAASGLATPVIGSDSGGVYSAEVCDLMVNGARCSTTSDGINLTNATATQPSGDGLLDSVNRVRNCAVKFAGQDGIVLGSKTASTHGVGEGESMAEGCYVIGSNRYGMLISAFDCNVWNCSVGANTQHSVVITGNNVRVYNTKAWYAGDNYYPPGSINTIGSGSASYDGFFITQHPAGGTNAIQLTGCQSQDNGRYGINFDGVSGVKVSGHMFGGDNVAAMRIGGGASIVVDGTVAQADRGVTPVLGIFDGNASGHVIRLHFDGSQAGTNYFQYVNSGSAKQCQIEVYSGGGGVNNVGNSTGTVTPNAFTARTWCYVATGALTIGPVASAKAVPGQEIIFNIGQDGTGGHTVTWDTSYHNAPVVSTTAGASTSARFVNINMTTDTPFWVFA